MEGESTAGLMQETLSQPDGVPDVTRSPEIGPSNAVLHGIVAPGACLFFSALTVPGSGKHTVPCYSFPSVLSPRTFLT